MYVVDYKTSRNDNAFIPYLHNGVHGCGRNNDVTALHVLNFNSILAAFYRHTFASHISARDQIKVGTLQAWSFPGDL